MSEPKGVTDQQITEALFNNGGNRAQAARTLGLNERTFRRRLQNKPELMPQSFTTLPAGHEVHGVSTLVAITDPMTGEQRSQWVKTRQTKEAAQEAADEAREAFMDSLPRAAAVPGPRSVGYDDLLNLHILTDYHLAMLAWGEETGQPWDISIAEDLLVRMFKYALKRAPRAKVGVLCQLGDFTHYDSFEAITPTSRNLLDSDTRPQKMVRVGLRVLRKVIEMMLRRYETVHVIMAEGNHDIMSSAWLREAFNIFYENEPRVSVDTRPDPYYSYEWGKTLLLFHHGHLRGPKNIDHVFVAKFKEQFGRSDHVYAHLGHLHHKYEIESPLMDIIQHPTIAANDAYATRHGYVSRRRAPVVTYHREFGEVGDITITPEMLTV